MRDNWNEMSEENTENVDRRRRAQYTQQHPFRPSSIKTCQLAWIKPEIQCVDVDCDFIQLFLPGSRLSLSLSFFARFYFRLFLRSHSDRRLIVPSIGRRNNERSQTKTEQHIKTGRRRAKKNNSETSDDSILTQRWVWIFRRWEKARKRMNLLLIAHRELICSRGRSRPPNKCVLTSKLASASARLLSQSRRSRQHRHRQRFPAIARLVVLNRERNTQNANQS